jgi:hypothetical protein
MALLNESFTAIRVEIEDLQPRHRSNTTSRDEILNQIHTLRRGIEKKVITAVQSPFSSDTANIS